MSTLLGMLYTFFYLAVALLAPGLALEAAAGIPFWISVVIVGATGTIYTMAGGMKSVVWTDAFQTVVVFIGIFAVIIKSTNEIGGSGKSLQMAEAGGRTNLNYFTFDIRIRHTWYGIVLGGLTVSMTGVFTQSTCQRISSLKSMKDAKKAMFLNCPVNIIYGFLCVAVGWCMYSYFLHIRCDPFRAGILSNPSQMTPFFVLHSMSDLPGFAGIYMSSLFSGALSTLSSGINALAANTVEDLLEKPLKSVTEKTATTVTKISVFIYGAAVVITAYSAKNLTGQVTQLSTTIFGTFGSCILGIFLLGCTVPWGNKYGAVAGAISSLAFNLWLGIGSKLYGRRIPSLQPVPTDGCYNTNATVVNDAATLYWKNGSLVNETESFFLQTTPKKPTDSLPDTFSPYDISYEWISVFGVVISYVVGIIVSRITRHMCSNNIGPEPRLIIPILRKFWGLHNVTKDDKSYQSSEHIDRAVNETETCLIVQ